MIAAAAAEEEEGWAAREAARASFNWRRKAKSRSNSMASAAASLRRCSDRRQCKSWVKSMGSV